LYAVLWSIIGASCRAPRNYHASFRPVNHRLWRPCRSCGPKQWHAIESRRRRAPRAIPRMKAPRNRRVFVIGRAAMTALGATAETTWRRAVANESGFRELSRCSVGAPATFPMIVGEIPDRDRSNYAFDTPKERHNWNAAYVLETIAVCQDALAHAKLAMSPEIAPRTACLMGSAIGGSDSLREAFLRFQGIGANGVSPFLLPNICANVPAGKAGAVLGFTGPIFSPQRSEEHTSELQSPCNLVTRPPLEKKLVAPPGSRFDVFPQRCAVHKRAPLP